MDQETRRFVWNISSRKFIEISPQAMLFATRNSISSCRPFAPKIGNTWAIQREIGGPSRCYRRFIIARVLVEIGFLCTRRNFPFYRDGFLVFVIDRPFNRLKCIVRFTIALSRLRKIPPRARKFDCLHFTHDSWDQSSITTWFWRVQFSRRETYLTSTGKKLPSNVLRKQMWNNVRRSRSKRKSGE